MKTNRTRLKYALPRGESLIRIVASNILSNLKNGHEAKFDLPPLIQRAYTIVNETGVIPYRDYDADVVFLEDTPDG